MIIGNQHARSASHERFLSSLTGAGDVPSMFTPTLLAAMTVLVFMERASRDEAALRHHSLSHSKLDELGARLQSQLIHHPIFVKGDRPRREIQNHAHFLHRLAL